MPENIKKFKAAVFGLGVGLEHIRAWNDEGIEVGYTADLLFKTGDLSSCNVASIATYDDDHGTRAIELLKRGFAVIVEKPLCLELSQLHEIAKLTEGTNSELSCNFPLRFHSVFQLLKKNIEENGAIYHLECDYEWGRSEKLHGWRGKKPYSVTHGAGSHMMNLAAWLAGSRIETVCASGGGISAGLCKEPMISIIGNFENGVTFRSNLNCSFRGQHRHRVVAWRESGKIKVTNEASTDKGAAVRDFARALKNGTEPSITRQEVLDTASVCFAVERSLKSNLAEKVLYL